MKLVRLKKELRRYNSGEYNLKENGKGYLFGSKNSVWEMDEDGEADCIADIDGDDMCIGHSENLEMIFLGIEDEWFEEIIHKDMILRREVPNSYIFNSFTITKS